MYSAGIHRGPLLLLKVCSMIFLQVYRFILGFFEVPLFQQACVFTRLVTRISRTSREESCSGFCTQAVLPFCWICSIRLICCEIALLLSLKTYYISLQTPNWRHFIPWLWISNDRLEILNSVFWDRTLLGNPNFGL